MEWAKKEMKKSRVTPISGVNAHIGISLCEDFTTYTDVIGHCSPYHNSICKVPNTISQN